MGRPGLHLKRSAGDRPAVLAAQIDFLHWRFGGGAQLVG